MQRDDRGRFVSTAPPGAVDWEFGPVQISHWMDENGVVRCTCEMSTLLSEGCQCGAIGEERKREKDNALEEA